MRGSVFNLSRPHLDGRTVSDYLSIYEVDASSYEEAERVPNDWQRNPDAWKGRRRHLETADKSGGIPLRVNDPGWHELIKFLDGPKAKT